ncbi:hypothetical protein [Embleya sp. NPDC005575]|uniref:hypothetical protein n=1 Tax=Embleya sp. NPDC005575 TaxID=3156892 RepID=UPI0033A8533C
MRGAGLGGGGAFATAPDLLRFALALHEGTLLGDAYTELMLGGKVPFGMGMAAYGTLTSIARGRRRIGHGSADPGITANLYTYPDVAWVALFVANQSLTDLRSLIEPPDRPITASGR